MLARSGVQRRVLHPGMLARSGRPDRRGTARSPASDDAAHFAGPVPVQGVGRDQSAGFVANTVSSKSPLAATPPERSTAAYARIPSSVNDYPHKRTFDRLSTR